MHTAEAYQETRFIFKGSQSKTAPLYGYQISRNCGVFWNYMHRAGGTFLLQRIEVTHVTLKGGCPKHLWNLLCTRDTQERPAFHK